MIKNRKASLLRLVIVSLPLALLVPAAPAPSHAAVDVAISITTPPPPLPIYAQPAIPGPGYLWVPGYWAWGPGGYYWVPGTWILPPAVGLLWTPGYWAWRNGFYVWNAGYWGPHVGFYGGVVYGFGYNGVGYFGGLWDHGVFRYNAAVNNFGGVHITNVYRETVVNNNSFGRASFNGGRGGTNAQPTGAQVAAEHDRHEGPTSSQAQHEHAASGNHDFLASVNHGRPNVAGTSEAGSFSGHGVVGTTNVVHNPQNGGQQHGGQQGSGQQSGGQHPVKQVSQPPHHNNQVQHEQQAHNGPQHSNGGQPHNQGGQQSDKRGGGEPHGEEHHDNH